MANFVGGICTSHNGALMHGWDHQLRDDPIWTPLFESYDPVRQWIKDKKVDVLFFVFNDHVSNFFFDCYPTFAIGIAAEYEHADEGSGPRGLATPYGDVDFSRYMADHLIRDDFDLTVCQEMKLDHGLMGPTPYMLDQPWPVKFVPFCVNVIQHPIPSVRRCWNLGKSVRKAIEAYPEDINVAIVGTGGLSHELQGTDFGRIELDWDNEFMDKFETEPESMLNWDVQEFMDRGGSESAETVMWFTMRAAMTKKVKRIHRNLYRGMLTGMAVLVFEDDE
ncbi:MAG: protocatechuate 3,4-dioxygenase [Kordiimonadaceae bacterium]|jgi:protocatechuate 4,5-dioxygenase, beta chain|nr:protocatechuate 3,4-dioxygenase [Kordiimonadaceae bacterium]MBT6330609.1 protocatechuate 3,4-dioxygenase [Kordiimonadaceae bacterium]MBT7582554.1 protocatechuate 3,4-dioxygenase [Kordiimonadaceae bacterium]